MKHNLPTTKGVTEGKSWVFQRPSFLPKKWEEEGISFCLVVACDLNALQLDQQIHLAKSKEEETSICLKSISELTERTMHCPDSPEQRRGAGRHPLVSMSMQFCPYLQLALRQGLEFGHIPKFNTAYSNYSETWIFALMRCGQSECNHAQGIQNSYPLYNKVTELMMGKAMSEGLKMRGTNTHGPPHNSRKPT